MVKWTSHLSLKLKVMGLDQTNMQNYFLNTDIALVDHLFIAVMLHLMVAYQIFLYNFSCKQGMRR